MVVNIGVQTKRSYQNCLTKRNGLPHDSNALVGYLRDAKMLLHTLENVTEEKKKCTQEEF